MPSAPRRVAFLVPGFALALTSALSAQTAAPSRATHTSEAHPARVLKYESEGEQYHAVLIGPARVSVRTTAHDHVVLFDTSASQTGSHRKQALSVLDGFLDSLPDTDRVRLFAIDVRPNELTSGFGTVSSENLVGARKQLRRRAPLGATDLKAALTAAVGAARDSKSASVVYIGDGVSGSRLIQTG
ncbi:MAG: hypothetical protein O3C17_16365, partial [Planctomycetota bacterium]|nr:hypothetical protein [Planctomycetota bacterium]